MKLSLYVLSAHLFLVFLLTGHHFFTKKTPPTHRISVRTIAPVVKNESPTPARTIVPVVKNESPAAARTIVPVVKSVSPTPAPSSSSKKPTQPASHRSSQTKILEEIAESLNTLSTPSPSLPASDLSIPLYIKAHPDSPSSSPSSADLLVYFLQNHLELPEQGEVTVKIAISSSGHLLSCEIVREKSKKNCDFLKKRLPELCFPCFNETTTFTITFRNADTF